jgi:hypothetical protein
MRSANWWPTYLLTIAYNGEVRAYFVSPDYSVADKTMQLAGVNPDRNFRLPPPRSHR